MQEFKLLKYFEGLHGDCLFTPWLEYFLLPTWRESVLGLVLRALVLDNFARCREGGLSLTWNELRGNLKLCWECVFNKHFFAPSLTVTDHLHPPGEQMEPIAHSETIVALSPCRNLEFITLFNLVIIRVLLSCTSARSPESWLFCHCEWKGRAIILQTTIHVTNLYLQHK